MEWFSLRKKENVNKLIMIFYETTILKISMKNILLAQITRISHDLKGQIKPKRWRSAKI